ncbi:hypothetical protein [Plasmodium yoelii yoelii]|uniref:Uncharacterized protein n=1 Tax=Plasmodium yoelii yoelii TaxID=73239 RepID=Q7RMN4_PLAYO|nr:hypothetical protein [Plasmodium yoelii yoelii]
MSLQQCYKYNNFIFVHITNMFIFINDSSEEIFKQNKHLLCTNRNESRNACNFMNDALKQLEHHATNGYKKCCVNYSQQMVHYKKKHKNHTKIQKIEYIVDDLNKVSINEQH